MCHGAESMMRLVRIELTTYSLLTRSALPYLHMTYTSKIYRSVLGIMSYVNRITNDVLREETRKRPIGRPHNQEEKFEMIWRRHKGQQFFYNHLTRYHRQSEEYVG